MKVVINRQHGGFGLSMKAVAKLAKLQGRKCYFFSYLIGNGKPCKYIPVSELVNLVKGEEPHIWSAFDIPNPNKIFKDVDKHWHSMSQKERAASNKLHESHSIDGRPQDRTDPLLIKVVEELGEEANGRYCKLKVVEIPDGTNFEIDEYDGLETIHEVHRSWS